jgi:hypothetical protein
MKIDDPIGAFDQQYMQEEQDLPLKLVLSTAEIADKLGFPGTKLAAEILHKVADTLENPVSVKERVNAMWSLVCAEFKHVESTKASHEDVRTAIQIAFLHDKYEQDDRRRERYLKVIGNALRSERQIEGITSFIQTVEQLNERDIIVLKVTNRVMNKDGDWKQAPDIGGSIMKLHPSNLIGRAQELTVQVALALGQKTETNRYSREVGYGICNRLQGFGLVHELEQTRELPLSNYCFRLSVEGVILLKLLGEEVPNFDYYFQE